MIPSQHFERIQELLICGNSLGLNEPHQNLETDFTEFNMTDLFAIPNLEKFE